MQSETVPPVPSSTDSSTQPPITTQVTLRDVKAGLQSAEKPLDFIKKNMAVESLPSITPDPKKIFEDITRDKIKADAEALKKGEYKDANFTPDLSLSDKKAEGSKAPEESKVEAPSEEAESFSDIPETPDAENFKKLRTKLRETSKTAKELESKKKEIEDKLIKYETGAALPDVIKTKEAEIERLSKYEKLHNLKGSSEYTEKFIKPISEIKTKLKAIATDYGVPPEEVEKLMSIESRAELNGFLSEHFDDIGALEVKGLVEKGKAIQKDAEVAHNEPQKALDLLQTESIKIREANEVQRKSKISNVSKDAWVESLTAIRKEGRVLELIPKENDPQHTEQYVKPILAKAGEEYSRLVRILSDNGINDLPKDLAFALARMTQLAHTSAVAINTRDAVLKHANELEQNTKRTANLIRPPIGGGTPSSSSSSQMNMNATPKDDARSLINSVLSRSK